MISSEHRFERAVARFDEENGRDPNVEVVAGQEVPRELAYARRLTEWVLRLEPEASEALRLAARCQHLRRWEVPRSQFPADRPGYHRWKNHLKRFHAEAAGAVLRECGYEEEMVERVQALNLNTEFPGDPESQTMEHALCLVFLEHQFADLAARTEDAKVINALRKSWSKMSSHAREWAVKMTFPAREMELLRAALQSSDTVPR